MGEEFGQAEDAGVVAAFAFDVVDAGPVGFGLIGGGRHAGDGDFDLDAIVEAAETHLAGGGAIVVKFEAEFAGRDYGGFELLDVFVGETGGVGEDAHGATCGALDDDLLFYLMSRGLPRREAEALMIEAFLGEAIDIVAHEGVRQALRHMVQGWLQARRGD